MSDIKISNLNFAYDKTEILSNINLDYKIKDFLSIIGPNGGGKSTLLKLILGLLKPKSGDIKIFDKNPKDVVKFLGYVPQSIPINSGFPITALEVVLMGLIDKKIFGFYSKKDKNLCLEFLKMVGMENYANTKISDLSGGQRQRIYIARALVSRAKILILDEPLASIDPSGQAYLYELLAKLNSQNIGILMVSHDVNLALNFANKVAFVSKNLFMHEIPKHSQKLEFLQHLNTHHGHFCDVELAFRDCGC